MKQLILIFLLSLTSCTFKAEIDPNEEILNSEHAFRNACKKHGIAKAFYEFADEKAVIRRENDTLIRGKQSIFHYYDDPMYKSATVSWEPDHISISSARDMAYSYGKYKWIFTDSTGNSKEYSGVYMTVWKRQADQSWKYVWD